MAVIPQLRSADLLRQILRISLQMSGDQADPECQAGLETEGAGWSGMGIYQNHRKTTAQVMMAHPFEDWREIVYVFTPEHWFRRTNGPIITIDLVLLG